MNFGTHVSIAGGLDKAPQRAHELGCECFQLFTRSPRGGQPSKLDDEVIENFLTDCDKYGLENYYVHTPYFINLASLDNKVRNNSIRLIREDLERASLLKVKSIMTHLGSSKGMERKEAIENVADSVVKILDGYKGSSVLMLENSAGQGDTIGDTFEEVAKILHLADIDEVGVCIDTAHMFGAGYDLRDKKSLDQTINKIENSFGLDRVMLIHGNDSKVDLGERKDRHEHIGKGKIGEGGFKAIVGDKRLSHLDIIVENPPDEVAEDIKLLKKYRK